MSKNTQNYGLFEYEPEKDGAQTFNIQSALNENWEKVDEILAASDPTKADTKEAPAEADGVLLADSEAAGSLKRLLWSSVKTALGKLFVPLTRKINGKTLSGDVTLTGDDIAMGSDDAETLRAAMAKRVRSAPTYLNTSTIFDYILSEYKAGRTAGFINALGTPDIPNKEKSWNYNVFYFVGEYIVAYAFRSYNNFPTNAGYVRFATFDGWRDGWFPIAIQLPPETHAIELLTDSTDNTSAYTIDQFKRCHVTIRFHPTSRWTGQRHIGTMPEGCRPAHDIVAAALIQTTAITYQAAQIFVQMDTGVIFANGDFSDAAYIFAQLTYPVQS